MEIKKRVTSLMVLCIAIGTTVIGRAAYVQLVTQTRLDSLARRQFQSKVLMRPRRGIILDRNGEPLAVNLETNSLAANPMKVTSRRNLARILGKATDIPYAKIYQRLGENKEFVWIKRHLGDVEMNRLRKWRVIDTDGDLLTGLWLVKESSRIYPHGELAAHILGDVNTDSEGVEGVELWMNQRLRGHFESVNAVKDALGRPSFIDAVAERHAHDGESIQLTIDDSLQFAAEQRLKAAVDQHGASGGSVIVMNAANGEILAMANEPSFNPNDKGVPPERRRNRALTDGYEPGSTLKAVLMSAALSHGWKMSDQVWGERGSFKVQGKRISEAEAKEKFEWLSLRKILTVSSNIGAAKVALKLGAENYYNELKMFGFGNRTDIGFPGEISGRVPPKKDWKPLTLANIGFGQGVLVTPIQITRAFATILNGGWLVQPSLLKNPAEGSGAEVPKRILTKQVADEVVSALETVTGQGGTGVKAGLTGYRVAGKTGTAQEVDSDTGKYSRSRHVSTFVGFLVNVEPKLVIYTRLDNPKGIYFASETAAPLFHEILSAVVNRFSIPAQQELNPTTDRIISTRAAPVPSIQPTVLHAIELYGTTPAGTMTWKMPALKGYTAREAFRALQGRRFNVEVRGSGVIHGQFPEEGKPIAEGETVRLSLSE